MKTRKDRFQSLRSLVQCWSQAGHGSRFSLVVIDEFVLGTSFHVWQNRKTGRRQRCQEAIRQRQMLRRSYERLDASCVGLSRSRRDRRGGTIWSISSIFMRGGRNQKLYLNRVEEFIRAESV
jgi:hypothetical protein